MEKKKVVCLGGRIKFHEPRGVITTRSTSPFIPNAHQGGNFYFDLKVCWADLVSFTPNSKIWINRSLHWLTIASKNCEKIVYNTFLLTVWEKLVKMSNEKVSIEISNIHLLANVKFFNGWRAEIQIISLSGL